MPICPIHNESEMTCPCPQWHHPPHSNKGEVIVIAEGGTGGASPPVAAPEERFTLAKLKEVLEWARKVTGK